MILERTVAVRQAGSNVAMPQTTGRLTQPERTSLYWMIAARRLVTADRSSGPTGLAARRAACRSSRFAPLRKSAGSTGTTRRTTNLRQGAEAFLDQLVVWRELAFNACARQPDAYDRYESLPG
jgi:hypothetical protein